MSKKIFFIFILLVFLLNNSKFMLKAAGASNKNILILNSYNSGFKWTDEQTSGILSSLSTLSSKNETSIEYLDWKRYPTKENLVNEYNLLKLKYKHKKIDVIICTDDAAFSFAMKYRKEIFSNAPIVFSGVNSEGEVRISKVQNNFTGVLENIEPERTILAAKKIIPSLKNIILIYDNTESGLSTGRMCIRAAKKADSSLNVISLNNVSRSNIIRFVSQSNKDTMILVTTYTKDIDGTNVDHLEFCKQLSKASPVPVFHLYDFVLGYGILGGDLIIGKLQGEKAGFLANKILNGKQANLLPVTDRSTNKFAFDYEVMKKYNISKAVLPKGSILINKPFSFIETYRALVFVVFFIFLLLCSFTVLLLFYIKKIRSMRTKLSDNNEELTRLYEELSASEEELRAQFTEVTEVRDQLEEYSFKLHHLAYHDTLTGLFNRLYLYEKVGHELALKLNAGALFFIDLDNFKFVNDALGHNIGDMLLKEISSKLLELSSKNNALIRLGGDEFVFYVNSIENKNAAKDFAKKIINLFTQPFNINDNYLTVTVSIGIALFPENGSNIDALLKNADMAMYKVKNSGRNGFFFFNNDLKEELLSRVNIENNFKKALQENEFEIYYQPQINTTSNKMDGFEALIRWNSPELGMLPPIRFITIAEETGFITTLGEWILKSACIFTKGLNDRENTNFKISVNISVIQLLQENFVDTVKGILEETSLSPELLELEITESVIIESPELVSEKIKFLRDIGIRIALDDFGTGYSSLSYLRNIPITTLKIDKSFIDIISNAESSTDVTDTIINLGHKMNLIIIAEGVETEAQLEYLKKNECDIIQGYLFYKPLPAKELEAMILQHFLK